MNRTTKDIDARKAEKIADRLVSMNVVQFDEEANGGRIVVCGSAAIYICTDCYAIGNINRFDSAEDAMTWAESTIEFFANAE